MAATELEKDSKIQKIKEILLNKVKELKWYYFDVELGSFDTTKVQPSTIEDFFNDIKVVDERYQYTGEILTNSDLYQKGIQSILSVANHNEYIFTEVAKRIFDINVILNESDANSGLMGKFNEEDRIERNKYYKELIVNGFRNDSDNIVLMAEGDSWFEFPRVYLGIDAVKDIVDWLIQDDNFAVYSLASGGDWLSNMLYTGEYIEELPKVSPDAFLISGGGNDLVGNHRLATMVVNPVVEGKRDFNKDENKHLKELLALRLDPKNKNIDCEKYQLGLPLVAEEFLQFMNLIFVQYFLFLSNLTRKGSRYERMVIVTHGYDFAIPSNKKHGNWLSVQRILNKFTDTGKWLFEALAMKGITKPDEQEAVVYVMIYEFNEVMIKLANYFPNVFHIDCRGVAAPDDWFDELHLKSNKFEQVSETYKKCIRENVKSIRQYNTFLKQKVYRVLDNK